MTVFGVNATVNLFQSHRRIAFKLEDAIGLFGKCHLVRIEAPGKAAAQAEPLGGCQEVLFAAEFLLSPLPILNIRLQEIPSDDAAPPVAKRKAANLKPSVGVVEAPEACFKVCRIA